MLGKRPCLLRTTSSRSLLTRCDDAEGEPASFCQCVQVTEQNPSPTAASPCKIIIGFDIGTEKKPPPDVCESPRSVLDMPTLLPPREKQQIVTRSPRSGLGSLLTGSGGNVGVEIGAHIQTKEVNVHAHVVSVTGINKLENCLHQTDRGYTMSLCVKPNHSHSMDTVGPSKMSNFDIMDADLSPWQGQAACVHLQEDECLDADISPRRVGVGCIDLKQDMKYNFNYVNITSPCQIKSLHAGPSKGLVIDCMDADISPQRSQAPWQSESSHVSPSMGADPTSAGQCKVSHVPPSMGGVDDCMTDHVSTWQSEAPCVHVRKNDYTDAHITPCQRQELHHTSLDIKDCKGISVHQSIFSAASPPSYPHNQAKSSTGFLNACAFCGRSLRLGKDIYIYRGDQAFCSAECRHQKIASDEQKEKRAS